MGVRQLYQQTLAERGYAADPEQLRAVAALERCENEWADYKARRSNAVTYASPECGLRIKPMTLPSVECITQSRTLPK